MPFDVACAQAKIRLRADFVFKVIFMKKGYITCCHFVPEWYYPVDKPSNPHVMYHKLVQTSDYVKMSKQKPDK